MENSYLGETDKGIFSRHTTSARQLKVGESLSSEYPSLTEGGVEKAREKARTELLDIIEKSPAGTILFIGGKSDQTRTGDTGEIYGVELKKISETKNDLFVLTKSDIDKMRQEIKENDSEGKIIDKIKTVISEQSNKKVVKVVVDYPLWIKELSYAYDNRWTDSKGKKTDYFDEVVKKYNGDHAPAAADWIENQGRLELSDGRVLQGPEPEKVAKEYLHGLARLQAFAEKVVPNRTVKVLGAGHQWDLDAVMCFLAEGKVNKDTFDRVCGGKVINDSELISEIGVTPEGKTSVKYRGQEFNYEGVKNNDLI